MLITTTALSILILILKHGVARVVKENKRCVFYFVYTFALRGFSFRWWKYIFDAVYVVMLRLAT